MKVNRYAFAAFVICFSAVLFVALISSSACAGTPVWSDNFDSYTVNAFPSSGGWQIINNGSGTANQYVDSAHAVSGAQSLHLAGSSCWSANAYHAVEMPDQVTLEGSVYLDNIVSCGCTPVLASLCLNNHTLGPWGKNFGSVFFRCDGRVYAVRSTDDRSQDVLLMTYGAKTWYKVRLNVSLSARTFSVYINNVLRGSNIQILDEGMPTGVAVGAHHGGNPVAWFDDISVFADACECDLNTDGGCNMLDWQIFGKNWGSTSCSLQNPCACDLNGDGRCNMLDWQIFGMNWGRTDCPKPQGKIVASNDDWIFSDAGFFEPNDPALFAQNIASWFTGGKPGKFLAYSDHFGLTGASLAEAMTSAGHSWTVDTTVPFDLATLLQYDGVFLGVTTADNEVLIDYVNAGGNVYVFSGGSSEPPKWNAFLEHFGLQFLDFHNNIGGSIPISSTHPICAGVDSLYHDIGTPVVDLAPNDPRNQVVCTYDAQGIIAVFDPNP